MGSGQRDDWSWSLRCEERMIDFLEIFLPRTLMNHVTITRLSFCKPRFLIALAIRVFVIETQDRINRTYQTDGPRMITHMYIVQGLVDISPIHILYGKCSFLNEMIIFPPFFSCPRRFNRVRSLVSYLASLFVS